MLTKLVITICEMIILTHKKKLQAFILSIGEDIQRWKITHFEGMENLMKMLIPLFPNSNDSCEIKRPL